MPKRKQLAGNRLFALLIFAGLFAAELAVLSVEEKDTTMTIIFAVISFVFIAAACLFTPVCYAFDQEGLSLCYLLLPNERYLWKDIRSIEVDFVHSSTRSTWATLLYAVVFHIDGNTVGPTRFYMDGNVRKSIRTKRLLEKYWDGTITGYLFEGVRKRIQQRYTKKQTYVKAHLSDEIVPMERKIRACVREWLSPFEAQAKQYDLELKTAYVYITKDFKEYRSRPQERYTYTLLIEIAHPGETDEERIYVVSIDLLYVRLGKTSYRGITNEHAEEEIRFALSDGFDTVNQSNIP